MAWVQVTSLANYNCGTISTYTNPTSIPSEARGDFLTIGNTPVSLSGNGSGVWNINNDLGFHADVSLTDGSGGQSRNSGFLYLSPNPSSIAGWAGLAYTGSKCDFVFFIDDDIEEAYAFFVSYLSSLNITRFGSAMPTSSTIRHNLYNAIKNSIPPEYQWQSVPAISGKNGTLSLTQILNINNGESVNNVPYTDNVDFTAVSKVNNMVTEVLQDGSAVTVEYVVPEDTYEYIKLVYKKDHIPEFVSDGTAVDVSQGSGEKVIHGIADGNIYWFVIFTDKSTSEPYKFKSDFVASVLYDGSLPAGQQFPAGVSYDLGNIMDRYSENIPTIEANCIRITEEYSVAPFIVFNSRLAICSTLKLLVKRTGNINGALHILGGVDNSQYVKLEPNYNNRSVYNIESASRPDSFNAYYHLEDMELNETVELTVTLPQTSEGLYIAILSGIGVDIYKIWGQ